MAYHNYYSTEPVLNVLAQSITDLTEMTFLSWHRWSSYVDIIYESPEKFICDCYAALWQLSNYTYNYFTFHPNIDKDTQPFLEGATRILADLTYVFTYEHDHGVEDVTWINEECRMRINRITDTAKELILRYNVVLL